MESNCRKNSKRTPFSKLIRNAPNPSTKTGNHHSLTSSSQSHNRNECYPHPPLDDDVYITAVILKKPTDINKNLHHKLDLTATSICHAEGIQVVTQHKQIPSTSGIHDTHHLNQLQQHQQKKLCLRPPIYAIRDKIQQQVDTNQIIIVKGQTGLYLILSTYSPFTIDLKVA